MRRLGRNLLAFIAAFALVAGGSAAVGTPSAYAANSGGTVHMYRLYNRVSHEHFYTKDTNERDVLRRGDWTYEGVGWVAPGRSNEPVYRLYNPVLGDHHYTKDLNEKNELTAKHGWRYEGIGWYSSESREIPVYRQFNPGLRVGSHNYTTDLNEYETNNKRNGWKGEGVAWYAVQAGWPDGQEPKPAPTPKPDKAIAVTPAPVTFSDNNGIANDTFTVPSVKGVVYKAAGKTLAAGTYKVKDYASYGSVFQAPLTVVAEAAAGYWIDGTAQWSRTFDGIETIAAPQPTFKDVTGGSSKDTVVIPNTPGVTYKVNGKAVNPGTLSVGQFVSYRDGSANKVKLEVTATEKPGYRISGTRNWTGHYDGLTIVTAAAPVFNDRNGQADDTFVIPSRTGVTYSASGSKKSQSVGAGTYKVSDFAAYTNYQASLKVEVKEAAGYRVEGDSKKWATLFDGNTNITPAAPTFADANGMANDTVTIPNTAGVAYYVGTKALAAGTYTAADLAPYKNYSTKVEIEAKPKTGYRLEGTTQWSKTFSGITTTTATAVTFTDENGMAKDTFTVPTRTGVTYYAGDTALKAGTLKVADYFTYSNYKAAATVTAKPKAGYALSGTTQWSQTIDGITTVTAAAVTFADKNGTASDTFTVPAVTGVQYVAGGKNVGTGTFKVADYFTYEGDPYKAVAKVTASPKAGYAIEGTKSWSKSISGITTVTPAAVTFTDENGMAKDTFTVPASEGVDYYAGEKLVKAGTYKVGSYFDYGTKYSVEAVIAAKPQATYALKGTTEWKQVMDGITTTSAQPVTFTDANGMASDTFTVPNVAGVQYVAAGKNVAGGKTYKVKDYFPYTNYATTALVTATAKAGYKLTGTTEWKQDFDGITTVATKAVTFSADNNGMDQDTFTVPSVTGVQYKAGTKNLAAGTYKVGDYFSYGTSYKATAKVTAVAKAGYKLTGDAAWSKAFSGITTVTPAAVTFADKNGMSSDTFTVPNVEGVQYKAGTQALEPGTYKVKDYFPYTDYATTAKLTATAKAGYKLSGTASWSQDFDGIATVTPKAVTFSADNNGMDQDTFTVPSTSGVTYYAGDKALKAGTYKVGDYFPYGTAYKTTALVTAVAKAGYKLSGTVEWKKAFSGITTVTTKAVTFSADADGKDNDTFTVPDVEGIQYKAGSKNVAAGTYKVGSYFTYSGDPYKATAKVTAVAKAGYKLTADSTTSWSREFDGWKHVVTKDVTFTDKNGYANDTVAIPDVAGIQYTVGGKPATAGTHKLSEFYDFPAANYAIVAKAEASAMDGYKIDSGKSAWQQAIDGLTHVNTIAPTFADERLRDNDTLVIPKVTGVQYKLNGANIAAGSYKVADKIAYVSGKAQANVTAVAKAGYVIDNEKAWSYTYADIVEVDPPAPTANDVAGRDGDTIEIPSAEGVQYRIDGTNVAPGTYKVAKFATYTAGKATIKVTAVAASEEYVIKGTGLWTRNFTADAKSVAPTFMDNAYSGNDYIVIPDNEGVYYTIDGVRVNPGTYSISGFENNQQRAVVHAYVADDAYENALGKAIWEHTYSESSLPTPQKRSTRTNDYGTKTASQASQILSQYASNLNVAISDSSTYAQYTTIGQVLGLDGKSVYQGTGALDSWTNPHRELSWRFAARYQQRLSEVRAAIGLNPIQLMRLTDSQEQALRSHAIYTQSIQGNGSYSAVDGSPTLWGVFEGTRTSGSGYAWDGTDVWQVPEAVSSGFHVARNYQTKVTPEQLADAAIVDLLSDAGTLTNRTPSTRLSYMLSDKQIAHYPSLHIHSMREGSDAATNSTFGFIVTDDFSWKQH